MEEGDDVSTSFVLFCFFSSSSAPELFFFNSWKRKMLNSTMFLLYSLHKLLQLSLLSFVVIF